jgi:hypothetical protein
MGGKGSKANIEPSKEKVIGAAGEEMHTYNDGAFKRVREAAGVADDFLMDGFDFRLKTDGGKMKEGGGKGGNLMGFTDNMMFIVKELNDTDHNTLLLYASEYANHMTHADGSLLCKILAHFWNPQNRLNYMVMNNVIPDPPVNVGIMTTEKSVTKGASRSTTGSANNRALEGGVEDGRVSMMKHRKSAFDLKGCNDDKILVEDGEGIDEVHKRIWHVHMWCGKCCWSDERKRYHDGKTRAKSQKFHITAQQKDQLLKWLRASVTFLVQRNLMDYSLMVSSQVVDVNDAAAQELQAAYQVRGSDLVKSDFPFISKHDGKLQVLHVGIIDFLQDWTCTKNIAMCIKIFERNKATVPPATYGARFIRHFTDNFVADAEPAQPLRGL